VRAVGHQHEGLDGLHVRRHGLDQRQEGQVEEQNLVFRVVGDPHHLVGVQSRIERVQHHARPRCSVVKLHVAVAVPGQCRDAVAEAHAQRSDRVGHAARTPGQVAVRIAVDVAFDAARDDFPFAVVTLGVHEQVRDQQWLLLHQSVHGLVGP